MARSKFIGLDLGQDRLLPIGLYQGKNAIKTRKKASETKVSLLWLTWNEGAESNDCSD
jgi:hypothetical protein